MRCTASSEVEGGADEGAYWGKNLDPRAWVAARQSLQVTVMSLWRSRGLSLKVRGLSGKRWRNGPGGDLRRRRRRVVSRGGGETDDDSADVGYEGSSEGGACTECCESHKRLRTVGVGNGWLESHVDELDSFDEMNSRE